MGEINYRYIYSVLVGALRGEDDYGRKANTIEFSDFTLKKSKTEDGKLCWIVENKEIEDGKNNKTNKSNIDL